MGAEASVRPAVLPFDSAEGLADFDVCKGRYRLRVAQTRADVRRAQRLRAVCFLRHTLLDVDRFDRIARHVLIEDRATERLVCCFRLFILPPDQLGQSYTAQFYDLSALARQPGPMMELGRFCVHPGWQDPDVLRLAWAAITRVVDQQDVQLLFGCSSFAGIRPDPYLDTFGLLRARHLAPGARRPGEQAAEVIRFAQCAPVQPDLKQALRQMPPLLRSYVMMGGWVSDHAVVDRQMNTLHVFTGLEIAAIAPRRKHLLRALI